MKPLVIEMCLKNDNIKEKNIYIFSVMYIIPNFLTGIHVFVRMCETTTYCLYGGDTSDLLRLS